jgi:hypothetical protein
MAKKKAMTSKKSKGPASEKHAKSAKSHKKHHPTAAAKKKYYALIVKSYHRLHSVLKKHNPAALDKG